MIRQQAPAPALRAAVLPNHSPPSHGHACFWLTLPSFFNLLQPEILLYKLPYPSSVEMSRLHDHNNQQQLLPDCSSPPLQRCDDWIFLDVPSNFIVDVSGVRFALHKFPLVTRSGRIRKLISEQRDADAAKIELHNLPGGADAFRLAAKFCYGINLEIAATNVAQLRCVADYLEMTEEYARDNLSARADAYLNAVVCQSLELCVQVLCQCENLLPLADDLDIVTRCTEAIAAKASAEQIASSFSRLEYSSGRLHMGKSAKCGEDWWIEDLSALRIHLYRGVVEAIKRRGVRAESVGASLVDYAEKALKGKARAGINEKAVVEAIADLLPAEKHVVAVSFLFGLLRSAVMLECSAVCRLNLERRIGCQLESATLDDLLIPSAVTGETMFDVDTVHRLLVVFSQQEDSSEEEGLGCESDGPPPPSQTALNKVGRLVDSYLAEIAPEANLKLAKFATVAEALPGFARASHDGLYRAIDIYIKAHQGLSEPKRKRLCKLIDLHKLSEEASGHAAQNERLPVQSIVQVLYIEQQRLRNALCCSSPWEKESQRNPSWRMTGNGVLLSAGVSPGDNYASLRRENRELKLELARMRLRLSDLEKGHACMKQDLDKSHSRKLIVAMSKKMHSFFGGQRPSPRAESKISGSKP